MKTTMTDVIKDEYKEWKAGDLVDTFGGTGSGKSYFVQNVLSEYAKENNKNILYLVPRAKLKKQIEIELDEKGVTNITVMMYQSLGTLCNHHYHNSLIYGYDYVVCDESHYFTNDSSFNEYTDITLQNIMSNTHTVTLFLSATGGLLIKYLKKIYKERRMWKYVIEQDFSFIHSLSAYGNLDELELRIKWLYENKIKTMIFIQSDATAYKIASKYKEDSTFVCGVKSNYKKYMDEDKVETMLKDERFETLFLVATSALDVGVNIYDEEVQHIIIDMLDTDTFIQCLGRKRFAETEEKKLKVLFRNYSNKQLGGFISKEANRVYQGKLHYGVIEPNGKKKQKASDIFYQDSSDGVVKVDDMKYLKANQNLNRYKAYVKEPLGYLKEIKSLLNYPKKVVIYDTVATELEKEQNKILSDYLNKELTTKEAKKVLAKLKLKNDISKREIKDFKIANSKLEELGIPYQFVKSKEYYSDELGKRKQAWFYTIVETRQIEQ